MQCTNQLWVVSPVLSGVKWVGHQPFQQRHPQPKGSSQLGLNHWAQLTGVAGQHYLSKGWKKSNRQSKTQTT